MARLPSSMYLMQQIGGQVILFEDGSEREIVRFDPEDRGAVASALAVIRDSELGDEDRCFAHFWSGYFASSDGLAVVDDAGLVIFDPGTPAVEVRDPASSALVVSYDPRDRNATARAQFAIFQAASLDAQQKMRAHVWAGYYWAFAGHDD